MVKQSMHIFIPLTSWLTMKRPMIYSCWTRTKTIRRKFHLQLVILFNRSAGYSVSYFPSALYFEKNTEMLYFYDSSNTIKKVSVSSIENEDAGTPVSFVAGPRICQW